MAGRAVAVVQFGDRPVHWDDVRGPAAGEVEQLVNGGLRDEQVGAIGSGGRNGAAVPADHIGDALCVWAEQPVVEISLIALRAGLVVVRIRCRPGAGWNATGA